jgi:hypothetical protein
MVLALARAVASNRALLAHTNKIKISCQMMEHWPQRT